MIAVIPTGGSNIGSITAALERLNRDKVVLTTDPDLILDADRVILPGVGHAQAMMQRLKDQRLGEVIPKIKRPVLGICLGMQILFESSEEGDVECLGIIPGKVVKIPSQGLVVPHMGWNTIEKDIRHELVSSVDGYSCYFVHSFCAEPGPWVLASCEYGSRIPAIVRWKNFYGTQFHPERSGRAGEALLEKFLCMNA